MLIVFCILFCIVEGGVNITQPSAIYGNYVAYLVRVSGPSSFSIYGQLVFSSDITLCSIQNINFNGSIAFAAYGTCDFSTKSLIASQMGASAVIIQNLDDALGNSALIPPSVTSYLPSLLVSADDGNTILNQYQSYPNIAIFATISPDPNLWQIFTLSAGFIFIEAAYALSCVALIAFIIYKFIIFRGIQWPPSLPQIVFFIELCGVTLRLVATVVDPWYAFRLLNLLWASITQTITLPLTFTSTILITLYWFHILSTIRSKTLIPHLKGLLNLKTKILAGIIILFLLILELTTDILRTDYQVNEDLEVLVTAIVYLILSLILSGVFLYTGVSVLMWVIKAHRSKKSQVASRISKLLFINTFGMIVLISGIVLIFSSYNDFTIFALVVMIYISQNIIGFSQVATFVPSQSDTTESGGTDETTDRRSKEHHSRQSINLSLEM